MPHPTRKRIIKWAAVVLLVGVVAYPLSYAPVVRMRLEATEKHPELNYIRTFDGADIPVDRLIDETPLQKLLFLWARLWGVETELEYAFMYRTMPQLYH
jgi:hypothetical protein